MTIDEVLVNQKEAKEKIKSFVEESASFIFTDNVEDMDKEKAMEAGKKAKELAVLYDLEDYLAELVLTIVKEFVGNN